MNQISLTMSLKTIGLTPGPLVCTLFALSLYVLKSTLLVFLRLPFWHQLESIPKVVNSFQYFRAQIEVWNLPSKFQNQFYSFLHYGLICRPQRLQPLLLVLYYDPPSSNGWHPETFWLWWQGSRSRRFCSMHWQKRAHYLQIVVPRYWRTLSQVSPYSPYRDPYCNCWRVNHLIPDCWRVVQ